MTHGQIPVAGFALLISSLLACVLLPEDLLTPTATPDRPAPAIDTATALSSGASVGEAVLAHVNVPLIPPWCDSREFHFGTMILLGDPTLTLRP